MTSARSDPTLKLMHRPFLFRGFKSSGEILDSHLGALEREVMDIVWRAGEINVREAGALLDDLERLIREKRRSADRGKDR